MKKLLLILVAALPFTACEPAGPVCAPTTCDAQGKNCGSLSDGCGGFLDCGSCASGETCGAGGSANVCGVGTCVPVTCAEAETSCGEIPDGCDGVLNCGACGDQEACLDGVCVCVPKTCTELGFNCGETDDGCGGTISCGTCGASQTCTANICECVPKTCESAGLECGTTSDGCGGTIDCGDTCSGFETCGGGGSANQCGCTALTCQTAGANCGTLSNGCGGMISCGASCTSPLSCGGAGTANVCSFPSNEKVCAGDFCWEDPVPQGRDFEAVFALAADDVWAAIGSAGVLHFDGTKWTHHNPDVGVARGVWAADSTHVFVAGSLGKIALWNGASWTAMTTPVTRDLYAVSGTSAQNVYAVGSGGTLLHYDGTDWTGETSGTTRILLAVHAQDANNVWAVGQGNLLRFNGTSWQSYSASGTTTSTWFRAVFALSPTDAWIGSDSGALYRFNGTSLTKNSYTAPDRITGIFGTASNAVFAVAGPQYEQSTLLKFNGTSWSGQLQPAMEGGLQRLHGTSATDIWAVGNTGSLAHFNGTSWSAKSLRALKGTLHAGTTSGETGFWATSTALFKSQGGSFSRIYTYLESTLIFAAWASSPTNVYFVGQRAGPSLTWYYEVLRYDGTQVLDVSLPISPTTTPLYGVSGSSPSNVFVVGGGGKIMRFNGNGWSNVASPTTEDLNAVWTSSGLSFAVGSNGTLLRGTASGFQTTTSPLTNKPHFLAVSGTSGNDVWAVGTGGNILHWDGTAWTATPSGTTQRLERVLAVSPTEAWVGGVGFLGRWNGTAWEEQPSPLSSGTSVLSGDSSRLWLGDGENLLAK